MWFPDPYEGEEDGLVAVGGDLSVDRLLLAYSLGYFPWYSFQHNHEPMWYCPLQRFVIFPSEIHISHSMKQLIGQKRYQVSINRDFEGVINSCAVAQGRNGEDGAWLGPEMINAYTELHRQGFAASIEVWESDDADSQCNVFCWKSKVTNDHLVGGLYGVNIGTAFFGESMFSFVPNASKLALIYLARTLEALGGKLIDCQFETSHLRSMGGRFIPYDEYIDIIRER